MLRREAGGEEKVDCEGCGKKRSPWGGAGLTRAVEKIARVAKGGGAERGMSTNRIDSLSRAGITSLYCRPTPDRPARGHPFRFSNPALFIYQPSYTWGRVKDVTSRSGIRHPLTSIRSHFLSVLSPGHFEILKVLLSTLRVLIPISQR